jgi:curli biogenesis system outer membrane secretion channel CsgG
MPLFVTILHDYHLIYFVCLRFSNISKKVTMKFSRQIQATIFTAIAATLTLGTNLASAQSNVEKCASNFGTVSVIEAPQGYGYLSSYGLGSPSALLRLMIQQSGCFDVVERGRALSSLQQERALAGSGELQGGSNVGKGQMQAADFVMTPDIQVSGNTGGMGGAIGGLGRLFGGVGAAIGGIAGGVKFKEAKTSILISDVRSGIQVAAAEGQAKKTDFGISGWGYGAGSWGGGGGYTNTPEGKMISASLLDNYNQVVIQIRDKNQLIKPRSESSAANAAGSIQATNQAPTPVAAPVQQYAPQPAPAPRARQQAKPLPVQSSQDSSDDGVGHVGSYSGSESGALMMTINNNSDILGYGSSPSEARFPISGKIDATGNINIVRASAKGIYQYMGKYNFQTQQFSGSWIGPAGLNGVFSGNKM